MQKSVNGKGKAKHPIVFFCCLTASQQSVSEYRKEWSPLQTTPVKAMQPKGFANTRKLR